MNIIADPERNSREKPGKNQGNPKLDIRWKFLEGCIKISTICPFLHGFVIIP